MIYFLKGRPSLLVTLFASIRVLEEASEVIQADSYRLDPERLVARSRKKKDLRSATVNRTSIWTQSSVVGHRRMMKESLNTPHKESVVCCLVLKCGRWTGILLHLTPLILRVSLFILLMSITFYYVPLSSHSFLTLKRWKEKLIHRSVRTREIVGKRWMRVCLYAQK